MPDWLKLACAHCWHLLRKEHHHGPHAPVPSRVTYSVVYICCHCGKDKEEAR